jgi:hypothetical protein
MPLDTGLLIAGASILTVAITKLKFYIKKNGTWTCSCGFLDKPLLDDDEICVKEFELSDNIKGIYVMPKGNNHLHHSHNSHHDEHTDSEHESKE